MTTVDDVYTLLARRDLASLFPAYLAAKGAVAEATDSAAQLALHEAITDSLDGLLTEIAEHGLHNRVALGIDAEQIDLSGWVKDYTASWQEVQRLRRAGTTSGSLIDRYVGTWMDPIGSRDWMNRMRLSSSQYQKPGWIERIHARISPS